MSSSGTWRQITRFVLVGGTNTLVTFVIFFLLALFLAVEIAYSIAFLIGLTWVVLGSSRFVFGGGHRLGRLFLFALSYLAVYLVGRFIIALIQPSDSLELAALTIVLIAVTTPLSFITGKLILTGRKAEATNSEEGNQ